MRPIIAIVGLLFLGSTSAFGADYDAGQLWSYKSRPGDEASLVLIDRVESDSKLGTIYHVSVLGVHIGNTKDGSLRVVDLPHCPVSRRTLDMSLIAQVGKRAPFEKYMEGYTLWKQAFDAGHAGVYSISVEKIIEAMAVKLAQNGQSL